MKTAIFNRETLKIELHFDKADYMSLSDAEKSKIKSAFLWSNRGGCWVSRSKEPNLYTAKSIARDLGFGEIEKVGDRLSFADQVERSLEKAANRAERYDDHADNAADRAAALQKPMNDMHGDIAFFTQPNINSSAGRAFTNYRNRVYASFERGMDEFRKSEYWKGRAETARETAAGAKYKDPAFLERKIKECKLNMKHMEQNIAYYDGILDKLTAGETVTRFDGTEWTLDYLNEVGTEQLERMEAERDKMAYFMDTLEAIGGIKYNKDNIKPGYIVKIATFGVGEVLSTGKVNFTFKTAQGFPLTVQFAEIKEVIKAEEKKATAHPFIVGDSFTVPVWNTDKADYIDTVFNVVKTTDKSVTLQAEGHKPFCRKPSPSTFTPGEWRLTIVDSYRGTVHKMAPKAV